MVLRNLRCFAGPYEVDGLHHGVDAEREELIEINVAECLVWTDLDLLLKKDRALVESFIGPENRQPRARLAHGNRPVNRRGAAVQGQECGMVLERPELRRIE